VLDAYAKQKPHLMILDEKLPSRIQGVIKDIRRVQRDYATQIIVTSAQPQPKQRDAFLFLGAQKYQKKELNPKTQLAAILECLQESLGDKAEQFALDCAAAARFRLLMVEDDDRITALYDKFISDEFFEKKVVRDGRQALKAYNEWKPEIMILDIMMPEMDGVAVLGEIRGYYRERACTILVATAKQDRESVAECAQHDIQGYLVKPFDLKTINKSLLKQRLSHQLKLHLQGHVDLSSLLPY
jgi:DNA-binding response OmpR family regulator